MRIAEPQKRRGANCSAPPINFPWTRKITHSPSGFYEDYFTDEKFRLGENEGLKGYAISLGAVTPLFGGNLYTAVNFSDGEFDGDVHNQKNQGTATDPNWVDGARYFNGDIQRWGFAVGYDYPLSKRTKVYGFAAYNEGEIKGNQVRPNKPHRSGSGKIEETDIEAGVGLIHYF